MAKRPIQNVTKMFFSDSTFDFCSVDDSIIRNGGYCVFYGEALAERVNGSHGCCYHSCGLHFYKQKDTRVKNCMLFNMTSYGTYDAIGSYENKGSFEISDIIYVSCINNDNGKISSSSVSIKGCIIANCTNFPESRYPLPDNEHGPIDIIGSLTINKHLCAERIRITNCGSEEEKYLRAKAVPLLLIVFVESSQAHVSCKGDEVNGE